MKTLKLSEYLKKYSDTALAINEAIKDLLPEGGCLDIEKGIYDFYPDLAQERHYYISNNDLGLKRIAMSLYGARNIVIDGHGSEFRFFGRMMPIAIDHSDNICIRNISIQYERPYYSEACVLQYNNCELTVTIDKEQYPYYIEKDRIHFFGYKWDTYVITDILQYNSQTRDIEIGTADFYASNQEILAHELSDGSIRLSLPNTTFPYPFKEGNIAIIEHATRLNPGIFGTESSNLCFENITVYHCEGMAFIMQVCENIKLDTCRVIPLEGRIISASADATHFVNCTGSIELADCSFIGQMDDATNIHGIYTLVEKIIGNRLYLRYAHFQQKGVPIYRVNDNIRFVKCKSMENFGQAVVQNVELVSSDIICLELDVVPQNLEVNDGVENYQRMPVQVSIIGCRTGKNRARSFLISCLGKVVIKNNDLYPNGAAVWISGDSNYWYESGPVQDVEICYNRITDSNRGPCGWGHAAIEIVPEIPDCPETYYHGTISIHDNEFVLYGNGVVYAQSVENLKVTDNRIRYGANAADESGMPYVAAKHCNTYVKNNLVEGQKELIIQSII